MQYAVKMTLITGLNLSKRLTLSSEVPRDLALSTKRDHRNLEIPTLEQFNNPSILVKKVINTSKFYKVKSIVHDDRLLWFLIIDRIHFVFALLKTI